jgi:hypothetical protein
MRHVFAVLLHSIESLSVQGTDTACFCSWLVVYAAAVIHA